jgi:hypothetical protein
MLKFNSNFANCQFLSSAAYSERLAAYQFVVASKGFTLPLTTVSRERCADTACKPSAIKFSLFP